MQNAHPKVKELAAAKNVGFLEAEQLLRFQAQSDPASAAVVKEIDDGKKAAAAAKLASNQSAAAALGLSLDQARALVQRLYEAPGLLTWLCGRVNLARLHDRVPKDDEWA